MNILVDEWIEPEALPGIRKGKYHLFFLDSMYQLVEASEKYKPLYSNSEGDSWTYGSLKNREATRELLLSGSATEAVLKQVEIIREKTLDLISIEQSTFAIKKKRVFSEAGSELSIDRVLCGDPLHWETRSASKKKAVRLAINYALSGGNSELQFLKLCALSIVAADLLAVRGYSVEILALSTIHNFSGRYNEAGGVIKIKDAESPVDIGRICCTSLPGMYRHYTFSMWQHFYEYGIRGNTGQCYETSAAVKNKLSIDHIVETKWIESDQKQIEFLNNIIKSL